MHEIDLITAVGRLLVNRPLRESFADDPQAVAKEMGLAKCDLTYFIQLNPEQLEAQAKTLISKRFHEVSRLIPETISHCESPSEQHFFSYAENFWPETHRRHIIDALNFLHYLKKNKVSVCHDEINRLDFSTKQKHFSIHFLSGMKIRGQVRHAVQIMCQLTSKRYEWCFYFSF